jgi:DNA-binding response OmpR family regulator
MGSGESNRILIAEDDEMIAHLLRFQLERAGYIVEHAADGHTVATRIQAGDPPCLAVLDFMLPFVDGIQLIRQIRASESWGDVPVLMLTARSHEDDVLRALEAGANDYVTKPFHPMILLARIRGLLASGR